MPFLGGQAIFFEIFFSVLAFKTIDLQNVILISIIENPQKNHY